MSQQTAQQPEALPRFDLRVLIGGRVVLLFAALLSAGFSSLFEDAAEYDRVRFIYAPIALLLALSALSIYRLRNHAAGSLMVYGQMAIDIALITGIIYVTGGPVSPFLFLYLPLVMAISILQSRGTGLLAALLSGSTYLLLTVSMLNGWLPPADGTPIVPLPASGLALQIVGLFSGMILVAILTAYLSRAVRSSYQLVRESQEELNTLRNKQHQLIDGISDGIITTDSDLRIMSVNSGAHQLLAIVEERAIGRTLDDTLREISDLPQNISLTSKETFEFGLPATGSRAPSRIVTYHRPLTNDRGTVSGYLFIFQDVTALRSIEEQLQMQERMARLLMRRGGEEGETLHRFEDFVGESQVMQRVFNLIERVAHSEATVLIGGESGTGKEVAAKAIHLRSARAGAPFVAVNCGAIPENLIESELFGHKKGSFTGAHQDHNGYFRQAEGGTIFLDEIGELPIQVQSKLLRVIQEKTVRPVGGERDISVNLRIVAASNRNLKREVEQGNFREDLYYRLNVINLHLPPLRERKEDIPLLARVIIERLLGDGPMPVISPAAMHHLMSYNYPGNVRELENILERATVFGGEAILPEHLPDTVIAAKGFAPLTASGSVTTVHVIDEEITFPIDLDKILSGIEKKYIEEALARTEGAKKKAADMLGMNLRSFRYRCQKYGISDDAKDEERV